MARKYYGGSTQGQRDGARGIEPKELYPRDARDHQTTARTTKPPKWTAMDVPPDHLEWARTRYLYPWVPTTPLAQYYNIVGGSASFCLANGWAVGTL